MKNKVKLLIIIAVLNLGLVTLIGCSNSKQGEAAINNSSHSITLSQTLTVSENGIPLTNSNSTNGIKVASTKEQALAILKNLVVLSANNEFTDAAIEEGKSGYKWDDGSYYAFTIKNKITGDLGDIGDIFLVKKNTSDVYVLDLQKDVGGNVLKRYIPNK